MSTTTTSGSSTKRLLLRILGAVVGVLVVFLVIDAIMGSALERRISNNLYAHTDLEVPPSVVVINFPVALGYATHDISSIDVGVTDVETPDLGLISHKAQAEHVTLTPQQLRDGEILGAPVRKFTSEVQLDVVSLGNLMGMKDLQLESAKDISPRGGWETEAVLEGTHDGSTKKYGQRSRVIVKLRVIDGDVHITPIEILDVWSTKHGETTHITGDDIKNPQYTNTINAFTLTIPAEEIPVNGEATRVFTSGGVLIIQAEQHYTTIKFEDLLPGVRK